MPSGTCESFVSLPEPETPEEESEDADDRVSRMFASRTAASLELFEALGTVFWTWRWEEQARTVREQNIYLKPRATWRC